MTKQLWHYMTPTAAMPDTFLDSWTGAIPLPRFHHKLAMFHCYAVYRTVHALRMRSGPHILDIGRALRQAIYAGIRGHPQWRRHFGLPPQAKSTNVITTTSARKRRRLRR
jgi:hypothetical protein